MLRATGNLRTRNLDFSAEEHIFLTNFASGHVVSPHLRCIQSNPSAQKRKVDSNTEIQVTQTANEAISRDFPRFSPILPDSFTFTDSDFRFTPNFPEFPEAVMLEYRCEHNAR